MRSFASALVRQFHTIDFDDTHFHLIEAMGRIMPEVSLKTSHWVLKNLAQRGAEVHLDTQLTSAVDGNLVLSTGETFESDIIVWTAGVMANPFIRNTDLPVEERGRLSVLADLRVVDPDGSVVEDAWGAGDVCAVPDLTGGGVGGFCVPNAQHAVRQGKLMAKNIVANLRGEAPRRVQATAASAPSPGIGLYDGVFQSGPIGDQGPHRLVHAPRLPRLRGPVLGAQDPRVRQLDHELPAAPRPGRHPGPRHPAARVRDLRVAPEGVARRCPSATRGLRAARVEVAHPSRRALRALLRERRHALPWQRALVAQLAEAGDLKSLESGFESQRGHRCSPQVEPVSTRPLRGLSTSAFRPSTPSRRPRR